MLRQFAKFDADQIVKRLAAFSAEELSHFVDSAGAIRTMAAHSIHTGTITHNNIPLAIVGVKGETLLADRGVIWAIFSRDAASYRLTCARGLREALAVTRFTLLWSYVDESCYEWAKKLGFEVSEPEGSLRGIWRS